jgi:phosphatidylserine/phosphatidylglycerophosphate/cardiolipin synthase-like enzyme
VLPFFSPDTSADASVALVRGAKESLDVYTPSVESWSGCSAWKSRCVGCAPDRVRESESFVLFRDLLNAAHRGVRVRLLTNRFDGVRECSGAVSVLSFLSANFDVRTYTSTTFQHAKVMIVDRNVTSISSVNWSKSSYLENREAGVVASSSSVASYAGEVFEYDWNVADVWQMPTNDIDKGQISRMKSSEWLEPFPIPSRNISVPHYSPKKLRETWCAGAAIKMSVSPDAGAMTMLNAMNATVSIDIYTYQITDGRFAARLLELADNGVAVRIVLSRAIYADLDRKLSTNLVDKMRANERIMFRSSPRYYRYAHLKIMIVDRGCAGERVALATGNLSPSDLPLPVRPFPPLHEGGASINRDFEIVMSDTNIVEQFQDLFDGDMAYSTAYHPPSKF